MRSIPVWPKRADLNLRLEVRRIDYDRNLYEIIFSGNRTPDDLVGRLDQKIKIHGIMPAVIRSVSNPEIRIPFPLDRLILYIGGSAFNNETFSISEIVSGTTEIKKLYRLCFADINKNVSIL